MNIRYCIIKTLAGLLTTAAWAQPSVIVRLEDGADPALVTALEEGGAAKQGLAAALFENVSAVRAVFGGAGAAKQGTAPFRAFTLHVADAARLEAVKAAWSAQPGVQYVQDNHRYRLDALPPARGDPLLDSLSHLPVIRAFEAWEVTTGSPDVRIGLIDTGLYFEHPDLAGQVWINAGEDLNADGRADPSDFNGIDDDGNGFADDLHGYDFVDRAASVEQGDYLVPDPDPSEDDQTGGGRSHGTLVAGVLAAARDNEEGITGVAPGCRLVPLRAFGADGLGDDDDVAAAIVYAAQLGLDVINLSFGDVFYSPIMHEAIRFAVAQGTVVVASAGNLGGDDPHYPSDYPEVISAAWLTEDGTGIAGRGTFGIGIDLGAPGSFVFTTLMPRFEDDGGFDAEALYGRRSGSSVAAPMVSGAAALLRSVNPSLTPASIRGILAATAHDLREPGWDDRTAAGLLDVAAALARALPSRVAIDSPDHDSGVGADHVAIIGSVADPAFAFFSLSYAEGDEELGDAWTEIAGPFDVQVLHDTLAVWDVGALPEGVYTLRLAASLRTGRTVEDRRRVYLDRTAPDITLHVLNTALAAGHHGVAADVGTDDLTDAVMRVALGGATWTMPAARRARRHGLAWTDESGRGGTAHVEIAVTNRAGQQNIYAATFEIPPRNVNTALFEETTLDVPHGYLLPFATDFDADGLLEITLNRYQDGWVGDTLATYEWDGAGFRPAMKLIANVIPRDVKDTDGDGLLELLTQVGGATLVLEQRTDAPYPVDPVFIDTTGLSKPFDPSSAFGARLTDLDGDGRGEILVHNTRQWRLLEYGTGGYTEVLRLDNPTGVGHSEISENEFQQPLVLIDDFDGDGRTDLLTGDGDGDWIIYEVTGDDRLAPTWTYETARYNAGARLGSGDFDGDGRTEFVTYTQNWTQPTRDNEREPDVGLYYLWDGTADDTYTLVDSLPVPGLLSRHGALSAADFDGDGRDELVLVDAPDLYVFGFDAAMNRTLRFHRGAQAGSHPSGYRSIALVTADFDGDGRPELVAAGADEKLHLFRFDAAAAAVPPPRWAKAFAPDAAHVQLAWDPMAADSVTVFRGDDNAVLDPLLTTTATSFLDDVDRPVRYALRGWRDGQASPLSEQRAVVPRSPAYVVEVRHPEPDAVEVVFSEPLDPSLRPDQFVLDAGGAAEAVLPGRARRSLVLRFNGLSARADTLRWTGVRDATGRPVGQTALAVRFPAVTEATLHLTRWRILGPTALELTFSAPLDPAFAGEVSNYRLRPSGHVVAAEWESEQPAQVRLEVAGRAIGATGLETALVVDRMQGANGERLAPEGNAVSLTQAAPDLAGVYVFPNPYHADRHRERVMVAGLPPEATILIFSVQGEPIRRLTDRNGTGGVAWDLRDEDGRPVPSGIYLLRVKAPGEEAVLRKAAIIR